MSPYCYEPIGYVRTGLPDEEVKGKEVEGLVEVFPEYREGLKGIEGFSHVILITHLHKVKEEQRSVLLVKPRRLVRYGIPLDELPLIGVFASDSPHRPNPIGLTIVEVVEIVEEGLRVRGLDLFDGTPVLDIKPYSRGRAVQARYPEWYEKLWWRIRREV